MQLHGQHQSQMCPSGSPACSRMAPTLHARPLRYTKARAVSPKQPPQQQQEQQQQQSPSLPSHLPSTRMREVHAEGSPREGDSFNAMARIKSLLLPDGFPASVTPDYLPYQLWSFPTHVTGWLSLSLTTSSLLQAVGFSAGPVGTTALTAAFKWIAKDGIGAAGRLLVGGKLGLELDDDPRRYRMLAELITTVGLAMEVSTSIYPQYFLPLACTGNFAKALGKGMSKPAFRVIQTHFASDNNVGAVAAKEEVWEVLGQLTGYTSSLLLLQGLENAGSSQYVIACWAVIQGMHVLFRRRALSALVFPTLSRKRACALLTEHVRGRALLGPGPVNRSEPLWEAAASIEPLVKLGCSLPELLGSWQYSSTGAGLAGGTMAGATVGGAGAGGVPAGAPMGIVRGGSGGGSVWVDLRPEAQQYVQLYSGEEYLLAWKDGCSHVALKEGTSSRALLRALWQAAWLRNEVQAGAGAGPGQDSIGSSRSSFSEASPLEPPSEALTAMSSSVPGGGAVPGSGSAGPSIGRMYRDLEEGEPEQLRLLRRSLLALASRFRDFEVEAEGLGWKLAVVNIKGGRVRVRVGGSEDGEVATGTVGL